MDTSKRHSGMKYAEENIRKYYQSHDTDKFQYSRPFHDGPKDPKNEFATLCLERYTLYTAQSFPGIMNMSMVLQEKNYTVRACLYCNTRCFSVSM